MSNILDDLGLDESTYNEGEASAVAKVFEAMPSAVYEGTVKEVIIYTNQWDGKEARYLVEIEKDGEKKEFKFRSDIGKTLKDGKPNKGYAGRLKQFAYATNTELSALSMGKDVTVKSFGKDCKGEYLVGMNGKKVKVLLRTTDDTTKAEGQAFKITNDIAAVVAMDGTDAEGVDAAAAFEEQIKKTPVFEITPKAKGGAKAATQATTTADGSSVDDML